MKQGELAQMAERWIRIQEAPGSIPGFCKEDFSPNERNGGNHTS